MGKIFLAAMAAMIAGGAQAEDCAQMSDQNERRLCEINEELASFKRWNFSEDTSKFTDEKSVFLIVESLESVQCGVHDPEPLHLALRCVENTTSMLIGTPCYLSSSYPGGDRVDLRIDDGKAFQSRMDSSTDNAALGLWSGRRSIPVIKELLGAEKLMVRFTPVSESPKTATFNIGGLDEVITPLREACGW